MRGIFFPLAVTAISAPILVAGLINVTNVSHNRTFSGQATITFKDGNPFVSQKFEQAANEDRLTPEIICDELKQKVKLVNSMLIRVDINVDDKNCHQIFNITKKPEPLKAPKL